MSMTVSQDSPSVARLGCAAQIRPDLVFELDRDGQVLDYHASHPELLHTAPKEFLGKPLATIFPDDPARILSEAVEHVIATGESTSVDYGLETKTGPCVFQAIIIAKGEAEPPGPRILVVVGDVTQQRGAEKRLRDSEDRHRTVLDQMQEAVIFADQDNIIRHINAFACRYLCTTREATVGHNVIAFHEMPVRTRVESIIRTFRSDPTAQAVSWQRSLGERDLIFRFSPVRDANGEYQGIIANLIDVTEFRDLQVRLQHAARMDSIARLAAGVAHDVNNLMVSVIGLAAHVLRRLGDSHPQAEHLTDIKRAGERASELANQLVAYSRTDAIHPLRIGLNEVVRHVTRTVADTLPSAIRLTVDLDPDLPDVYVDALKMEQVLLNLCKNGIEAIDGAGQIEVRTQVGRLSGELAKLHPESSEEVFVLLSVRDDGCGMDADTRRRVFEPYFATGVERRGLGLASVHGIVTSHNGYVDVQSQRGRGSTFTVYVPVYREAEDASPGPGTTANPPRA
jgi:PAS domain S-box-containing protein